ncbi:MAG: hypothetical protein Q8R00_01100 [Candidatus Nanoarchaeia archaeon]|nr:hypothetical protein [Candidatus Nanoarchaeia archaeon]
MKIKLIESRSKEEFEKELKECVKQARHVINIFFTRENEVYSALLLYEGFDISLS